MDCLYAECKLYITDCVMGELETLGTKYRVGLKISKVNPVQCSSFIAPTVVCSIRRLIDCPAHIEASMLMTASVTESLNTSATSLQHVTEI